MKLTPVPPPVEEPRQFPWGWLWALLIGSLVAGGLYAGYQMIQRQQRAEDFQVARGLVESAPLPPASLYSTLRQYFQTKQITTRWEYERTPAGRAQESAVLDLVAVGRGVPPLPVGGGRLGRARRPATHLRHPDSSLSA